MAAVTIVGMEVVVAQSTDTSRSVLVPDSVVMAPQPPQPLTSLPIIGERLETLIISMVFLAGAGLYLEKKRRKADSGSGLG